MIEKNAEYPTSSLNLVKRGKKKAAYDRETIYSVLDATEVCQIAFIHEGRAMVQPINFGRNGDKIYVHGSQKNRMTTALVDGGEACVNVTLLDGMKLTRSAFHHSVNYRSAMIFGPVREVTDNDEKIEGLKAIINHFVPDRWDHCRPPNQNELKATKVIEITIEQASAKIADTPPSDNKEDLILDYWAGTIPVKRSLGKPIPDVHMKEGIPVPDHIQEFCEKNP